MPGLEKGDSSGLRLGLRLRRTVGYLQELQDTLNVGEESWRYHTNFVTTNAARANIAALERSIRYTSLGAFFQN